MTIEQIVNKSARRGLMVPVAQQLRTALSRPRADRAKAAFIVDLMALATGIAAGDIASPTRCHARAARARQVAMYLAYVAWQWPLARVGAAFGRDRTTAGYACRLVEDLRDDELFDARLDRLEACLRAAPEPHEVRMLCTNLVEMAV